MPLKGHFLVSQLLAPWHNFSIYFNVFFNKKKEGYMVGWKIIQSCEHKGAYSKQDFIQQINQLSSEQFNKFCREYWALLYFYDTNVNAYCTNQNDIIEQYPTSFFQLQPIDGDAARSLEKIL